MNRIPLPSRDTILSIFNYENGWGFLIKKKNGRMAEETIKINKQGFGVGRVIYFLETGEQPENLKRIDGNYRNNKFDNLTPITEQEKLREGQKRKREEFKESETILKAKNLIDEGYSGYQIYKNLMKGEISHPTFRRYLGDYYESKKIEKKKDFLEQVKDSFLRNNKIGKYTMDEMSIGVETLTEALNLFNIEKQDNLTGNTNNLRHGIIRPDFFEKIDCEENAYFLGLMYADGYVVIRENKPKSTSHLAAISLKSSDDYLLEKFSDLIYGKRLLSKIIYEKEEHSDAYRFSIHNKKICLDLINLGCIPNKSKILQFPTEEQVPENLIHHFIRGYFDGDGSCGIYGEKDKLQFSICGSVFFIDSLSKYLNKKFNYKFSCYNTGNIKVVASSHSQKVIEFRDFIYENSSISMKRKRDIFFRK